MAANVVRLVVAGDALATAAAAGDAERRQSAAASATAATSPAAAAAAAASQLTTLEEVDVFLALLGSSIPLDLMPGAADPTTFSLPQLSVHSALLPRCRRYASITSYTNPHAFAVDQTRFIGASGQPVKDICKFSSLDPLSALELCVEARCLAPTAPDTLSMYPFIGADPFCMTDSDDYFHVYFSSNHEALRYKYLSPDALSPCIALSRQDEREEEQPAAAAAAEAERTGKGKEEEEAAAAVADADTLDVQMQEEEEEETAAAAAAANHPTPPAATAAATAAAGSSHRAAAAAAVRRHRGPLLLCIPDFSRDATLVLVEVNSLAVIPIRFAVCTPKEDEEEEEE